MKGLEPEIERIMDKHKADVEDIERGHHVSVSGNGEEEEEETIINTLTELHCSDV